jgi:putative ABC transport system substrate-binding protein
MQFDHWRRRDFITLLGRGATLALPLAARAQQPALPVIGVMHGGSQKGQENVIAAFEQGLGEAGYIAGKNVTIVYRWANFQYDRLPEIAAELVRDRVVVIATMTPSAALAAKHATTSIPIVFGLGSDPIRDGLVASLNRPGGNITGATFFGNLLAAKRMELLHQLVPNAKVIAVLLNPKNANVELEISESQMAARALGLELVLLRASSDPEIDKAFANLVEQRAAALLISGDVLFNTRREQIAKLAMRYAVPTSSSSRLQVVAGGLMSLAPTQQIPSVKPETMSGASSRAKTRPICQSSSRQSSSSSSI